MQSHWYVILPLQNPNYQTSVEKIVSGAAQIEKSHKFPRDPVEIDSRSTEEDKSDVSTKTVKDTPVNTLEVLDTTLTSGSQSNKRRKYSQNIVIYILFIVIYNDM